MRLLLALALATALGAPAAASAASGDLDTGFAAGGIFTSQLFGTQGDFDNSVARDSDGRILLLSGTDAPTPDAKSDGMAITRLTPAGALDTTFNPTGPTPGELQVDFGPDVAAGSQVLPRGLAVGPGGTITAIASITDPSNDSQLSIVRLTTDGGLDSSFDGDGRLLTPVVSGFKTFPADLLVDPYGSILVAATQTVGGKQAMLVRFTPAGAIDTSYGGGDGYVVLPPNTEFFNLARTAGGGDGIVTSDFAKGTGYAIATGFAVAVDGQSRILLGGQRTPASGGATGVVTRFSSTGDPDTGFGPGTPGAGVVTVPGTLRTAGLLAGCGGAIVASGQGSYDADGSGPGSPQNAPVLARVTSAGAPDPAFGNGTGFTLTPVGVYSNGYRAIADGARVIQAAHRSLQAPPFDVRPVVLAYQDATGCAGTTPGGTTTPPGGTTPPPSTTPTLVPVGCAANRLILTDVFQKGARTQVLGVAPRAAAGKRVSIVSTWNGKVVARTLVKPDLSFAALVPLPPRSLRLTNRARFTAKLGSKRSAALKFARRLYTTAITVSGSTVTFKGTVTKPLARPVAAVRIRAAASCSAIASGKVVATVKPSASGAFTARFALPSGQSVIFLRAQTAVLKHAHSKNTFPTFTLVRGVRIVG